MFKALVGILVGGFAVAAVPAQAFTCQGFAVLDRAMTTESFQIDINRTRFDEGAGTPVSVVIKHKLDSNTARPNLTWKPLLSEEGRMVGDLEAGFTATFPSGAMAVQVGNSGITGRRHALDGTLSLKGHPPIRVSCPQAE